MQIYAINEYNNYYKSNNNRSLASKVSFKSYEEIRYSRAEIERLRKIEKERRQIIEEAKRIAEEQRKIAENKQRIAQANELQLIKYLPIYDVQSEEMRKSAQFTLNLASSLTSNSEHKVEEFFGTEEEANKIRKTLRPSCLQNSIEMREALQKLETYADPVDALISANMMTDFIPKDAVMTRRKW